MAAEAPRAWLDINHPTLPPVEQREWRHVLWHVSETGVLALYKAAIDYSEQHSLRDSLAYELEVGLKNRATEDAVEGRQSFPEKRTPVFKGR
jgi:hypothetical protein